MIFIRFDDVYKKTTSFVTLCELFLAYNIPICLGVIPARATRELVLYLKKMKKLHPDLIEIDQHGYKHLRNNKGEFDVPFTRLLRDISAGKDLIKKKFADDFSGILTVPWHAHSNGLFLICKRLNYIGVSITRRIGVLPNLFYTIMRSIGLDAFFGYHIYQGVNAVLPEISPTLDIQLQYFPVSLMKNIQQIRREYVEQKEMGLRYIGVLIHPQCITTDAHFLMIKSMIAFFISKREKFVTMISLLN